MPHLRVALLQMHEDVKAGALVERDFRSSSHT
jgi:hypothetical protein